MAKKIKSTFSVLATDISRDTLIEWINFFIYYSFYTDLNEPALVPIEQVTNKSVGRSHTH